LAVLPKQYWQYKALFNTSVSTETPQLVSVQLNAISTGTYYSKVDYLGSGMTAWGLFSATEELPGYYSYAVRTSTKIFTPSTPATGGPDAPAWVAQTVGQNVSASTATYAQFSISDTNLTDADDAGYVQNVLLQWSEGANIPTASATLDRRYLLCVAISTSAFMPDTCLLQQKTGKWVTWSGPTVAAAGIYNNNMVIAEGDISGNILKAMQEDSFSDDGAPIESQWVSGDFTGGSGQIFLPKVLHGILVDALPVTGSSVTVSYQVGKAAPWTDYTFSLDNGMPLANTLSPAGSSLYPVGYAETGNINQWIPLTAGYAPGQYLRFKFSNTSSPGTYWRVNSFGFLQEVKPFTHN
jgi:hypothetical protein